MTSAPVAEVIDVRKQHGAGFALEVEKLSVAAGEIVCLLGPTGAGKTTLLSLLAAATTPQHGDVRVCGEPLSGPKTPIELLRNVTMVFQRPLMLSGTVQRNVEFGLRLRKSASVTQVDAVLERLGLSHLATRAAASLSGGETQLTALARALAVNPSLLLLDEPTASLDAARVGLVEAVIREVVAQTGMAVVWATHNLFQAKRVADRVALLLDGRVIEVAPTEMFFHHPADERSAAFVDGRFVC